MPMPDSHDSDDNDKTVLGTHRIQGLQDGVFAIVMTLLVLELRAPDVHTNAELQQQLLEQWPILLGYIVSFINLGIYWVAQQIVFHYVIASDRVLAWLNVIYLMCVSLLPFSAAMLGRYPDMQLAYAIYGINLILIGLNGYAQWCYATKYHRLTTHSISPELVKSVKRRILVAPIVSAIAIAFSFVSMTFSLVLYILLALYYVWPGRVDKFWRQPAVPHTH